MMRPRSLSENEPTEGVNMDCKPVGFISLMLISFWLMLSYLTNSYFIIFLIFSNFILLFACCVSLSGYVLRRYIDVRQEQTGLTEITTISGRTPYIMPDYPPSYEEATRNMSVVPCHVLHGHVTVPACTICASHQHLKEISTQQPNNQSISSSSTSTTQTTPTTTVATSAEGITSTQITSSNCRSSTRSATSNLSRTISRLSSSSRLTSSSTSISLTSSPNPSASSSNSNSVTLHSVSNIQCGEPPPCYSEEKEEEKTENNLRDSDS